MPSEHFTKLPKPQDGGHSLNAETSDCLGARDTQNRIADVLNRSTAKSKVPPCPEAYPADGLQQKGGHCPQSEQEPESSTARILSTEIPKNQVESSHTIWNPEKKLSSVHQGIEGLNQFSFADMQQPTQHVSRGDLDQTKEQASVFHTVQSNQPWLDPEKINEFSLLDSSSNGTTRQRRKWDLPHAMSSPVSTTHTGTAGNCEGGLNVPKDTLMPFVSTTHGNQGAEYSAGNHHSTHSLLWDNASMVPSFPSLGQGISTSVNHGPPLPQHTSKQMYIQNSVSNCSQGMDSTGYKHNPENAPFMGHYTPMPTDPSCNIESSQAAFLMSPCQRRDTAAAAPCTFQSTGGSVPKPICSSDLDLNNATDRQAMSFRLFRSSIRPYGQRPQTAQSILVAAGSGTKAVRERLRNAIERESAIRMEAEMSALDIEDLKLQKEVSHAAAEEEVSAQEELWKELQVIQ